MIWRILLSWTNDNLWQNIKCCFSWNCWRIFPQSPKHMAWIYRLGKGQREDQKYAIEQNGPQLSWHKHTLFQFIFSMEINYNTSTFPFHIFFLKTPWTLKNIESNSTYQSNYIQPYLLWYIYEECCHCKVGQGTHRLACITAGKI